MNTPIWITNFKNYEQSTGQDAVELAKIHDKVARETGKSIAVVVSPLDVYRVSREVSIPVFCSHVDPIEYGSFTGHILPRLVRKSGGTGTLLNHSERRIDVESLDAACALAQKANLRRIICAESPAEVEQFASLDPDFIAFEPPELIGATHASVATAHPHSIIESVALSRNIPLLVGAGVSTLEDVRISLELGAKGFLVATAIVKAANPEKKLREFVSLF
ncbi:triose-phosphate isomerase [Candidatus Gracilibacteria bacterium]|nr:triose-phosphate isomerase [Candidatus Gracilibacteria bacterium]